MKILISTMAALAVMTALAIAAVPAASQDVASSGGMPDLAMAAMPKAVMMTISADGMADGNVNFKVPYGAKVYEMDGKEFGIVATYNTPLMGMCDVSAGSGTISMADALPAKATVDYAERTAIPVAGSSAVLALQDFRMTGVRKGTGTYDFQFGRATVYMPDGTAKPVTLDQPIRMSVSVGQMKLTIVSSPAVAEMMAGLLMPGKTFPPEAAPVMVNDILAAG